METLRLILGSKSFATIAGGSLLMVLGAALGIAIGSDPSSNAATSLRTVTENGTTRIVAVAAKPHTKTVKHRFTVTRKKTSTVTGPGSTALRTVTEPGQTVTHTVTQTKTVTVPTTVTITTSSTGTTTPVHPAG
jgi:hypothetical protein